MANILFVKAIASISGPPMAVLITLTTGTWEVEQFQTPIQVFSTTP